MFSSGSWWGPHVIDDKSIPRRRLHRWWTHRQALHYFPGDPPFIALHFPSSDVLVRLNRWFRVTWPERDSTGFAVPQFVPYFIASVSNRTIIAVSKKQYKKRKNNFLAFPNMAASEFCFYSQFGLLKPFSSSSLRQQLETHSLSSFVHSSSFSSNLKFSFCSRAIFHYRVNIKLIRRRTIQILCEYGYSGSQYSEDDVW